MILFTMKPLFWAKRKSYNHCFFIARQSLLNGHGVFTHRSNPNT